jgi:DnaJ-class molecular chaperone
MNIFESLFGSGPTVRYKKNIWGQSQKVVEYKDSGKKKTYTHGSGLFGDVTKVKTEKHGDTIENGYIKKNLYGGTTEHLERTDGTRISRRYSPGLFRNRVTTQIDGKCFKCDGTGSKTLDCKICCGSGTHSGSCQSCVGRGIIHLDARPCFTCQGTGIVRNAKCRRCNGSGQHKPATDVGCKRCNGIGKYSVSCKKCSGRGNFTVTCNKCRGSGRYSKTEFH